MMPGPQLSPSDFNAKYGQQDPNVYRISAKGFSKQRSAFNKFFNDDNDTPVDLNEVHMVVYGDLSNHPDRVYFLPSGQIIGWETSGGKADSYWDITTVENTIWLPQHLERDAKASVLGLRYTPIRKPKY